MNKILTILLALLASNSFAQISIVTGKIVHADTKRPFEEVTVMLPQMKISTTTKGDGNFRFSNVPFGTYDLVMSPDGFNSDTISITVSDEHADLGTLELDLVSRSQNNFALENSGNNIEDATSGDENSASSTVGQNVASVLNASRDPYLSAATFGWGQYFYRIRGYENDKNLLYLNGVPMNDLEEGGIFFNSFSGLNDVFRGRNLSLGLAPNEYNFGTMGLNTSLDASASNQRKGTRLTYTATNRSYRNRLMLTHSSGLLKSGWAYSFSLSRRWANQGQIKGTFYDAYGYFAAIEKRFKNQGISLTIVGAPLKRGKAGPATAEAFKLAGTHYYNPYWGYQDGEIRNTRVLSSNTPMAILSHDAKLGEKTNLTSALSFQTGETSTTTIDWYNSADPRPDYYKYMPSYLSTDSATNALASIMSSDPDKYMQVDWDGMYEANLLNKKAGYGRSNYILASDVETTKKLNAAVNLQSLLSDHITFYSGITYQIQNNHDFRRIEDLLGGDYWLNINQFAEDGIQGLPVSTSLNLDETNQVKKEGDSYSYDYNMHFSKANWFAQSVFIYNKFDFFLAGELGYTNFYRTGNYRHGLYPNDSKGNSQSNTFFNYQAKGGVTYKMNGRNYFYANGSFGTRAPFLDNVFVAPRTRNQIISNPQNEDISSAEVGYLKRSPNFKGRLTFFASEVKNASDIKRYFNDIGGSFTNNVIQGINKRYTGMEIGAEIKLSPSFTVNLAGALTQAFYTSRATSKIYNDNDVAIGNNTISQVVDTLYIKNYYLPVGPQKAFQAGLSYRSKKYWYATLSVNYLANNWIDFTPASRTVEGVDLVTYNSPEWHAILDQKKLPSFYTLDLFGGKSFKMSKYFKKAGYSNYLNLNIGINNILNNKNIQLYGFENLRIGSVKAQPDWFVPKYGYALGTQYFINLSLQF